MVAAARSHVVVDVPVTITARGTSVVTVMVVFPVVVAEVVAVVVVVVGVMPVVAVATVVAMVAMVTMVMVMVMVVVVVVVAGQAFLLVMVMVPWRLSCATYHHAQQRGRARRPTFPNLRPSHVSLSMHFGAPPVGPAFPLKIAVTCLTPLL